jgi:hypothetical protein
MGYSNITLTVNTNLSFKANDFVLLTSPAIPPTYSFNLYYQSTVYDPGYYSGWSTSSDVCAHADYSTLAIYSTDSTLIVGSVLYSNSSLSPFPYIFSTFDMFDCCGYYYLPATGQYATIYSNGDGSATITSLATCSIYYNAVYLNYGATEADVCSVEAALFYLAAPNTSIANGLNVYINTSGTLYTGDINYIAQSGSLGGSPYTSIYNYNGTTATIGTNTGISC